MTGIEWLLMIGMCVAVAVIVPAVFILMHQYHWRREQLKDPWVQTHIGYYDEHGKWVSQR